MRSFDLSNYFYIMPQKAQQAGWLYFQANFVTKFSVSSVFVSQSLFSLAIKDGLGIPPRPPCQPFQISPASEIDGTSSRLTLQH